MMLQNSTATLLYVTNTSTATLDQTGLSHGMTYPTLQTTTAIPDSTDSNTTSTNHGLNQQNMISDGFFIIFFAILISLGSLANIFIIMVILCVRTLHKAANYYVLNVCFADLIICAVIGPYNLYTIVQNREIAGCETMGTLTNLALITSITSLTAVAVNRYFFIKLPLARYSALYKHYKLAISILVIWLVSVALTLPLSLAHTRGGFDESLGICVALLPDSTEFKYFYQLSIVTITGLPAISIMLFCYYKIYKIFKQSIETVHNTQTRQNNSTKDKYKLTRNLFIITILFGICWLPEFIATVLNFNSDFPPLLFQITGILAQSNSIINPFTYVLLNKKFFNVLVKILTCNRKCCFKTVAPPIGGTTKIDDSPTATIHNVSG